MPAHLADAIGRGSQGVAFCGSLAECLENRKAGAVSHPYWGSKETSSAGLRDAHCLTCLLDLGPTLRCLLDLGPTQAAIGAV